MIGNLMKDSGTVAHPAHVDEVRVDEYRENGSVVIRAELPGVDPERDVEVSMNDGMLRISAHVHYGWLVRTMPLPPSISDAEIRASFDNGVLEVRVPVPMADPARKIQIYTAPHSA